jgi:hypothetical protein
MTEHVVVQAVEDVLMADIVWTHMQIDDEFQKEVGLQRHQYVNQFPGETCFVMKHFLAQTVQKVPPFPSGLMIEDSRQHIITVPQMLVIFEFMEVLWSPKLGGCSRHIVLAGLNIFMCLWMCVGTLY